MKYFFFQMVSAVSMLCMFAMPAVAQGCFRCEVMSILPDGDYNPNLTYEFYSRGSCPSGGRVGSPARVSQSYCLVTSCSNPDGSVNVEIGGPAFNQVRITVNRNGVVRELFHPIGDGTDYNCTDDVFIGNNYVTVRHGDNRDRYAFYGIEGTGRIVGTGIHLPDGAHHNIEPDVNQFVIRFGVNSDNGVRYCFSSFGNTGWSVATQVGYRGGPIGACNTPVESSIFSN